MKFFSISEILSSIMLSAFLGVLFGGIYFASELFFIYIKQFILILPRSIGLLSKLSREELKKAFARIEKAGISLIERNVYECLLFLVFGILFILCSYVSLDGYIRVYFILSTVLFAFISYRSLGKIFSAVLKRIFGGIYLITLIIFVFSLYPVYYVLNKIYILIRRASAPLVLFMVRKRSDKLLCRKYIQINEIFEKQRNRKDKTK